MPRTEEQNQNIKDKRRAKILKGAVKIFADKGIDNVPVDDITKTAKCSHGLFYHYFDNKDGVVAVIIDELIKPADLLPPCRKAKDAHGVAGLKILADYFNRVFNPANGVYNLGAIATRLFETEDIPESHKHLAKDTNLIETLKVLVGEGQEIGKVIPGDPAEIAVAIYDVVNANFARLNKDGKKALSVSGDVLYGMLLKEDREN